MSSPADLLDRIRTHVYLNDIYPIDWFEDFDKLRSGRVTNDRFRRWFEFIKLRVSDADVKFLFDTFGEKEEVNYRAFCRAIQDIFTNQDLETSPTAELKDAERVVAQITGKILEDITPELDALFAKMYHQVKTRGVHVRESYMDFDTHNVGRVTCPQFLRNNPFIDLSAREVQILLQRYMDPILRDVNYKRLHLDIQAYTELSKNQSGAPDLSLPHHKGSIKLNPLPSNPEDVIPRFGTYCRKNRVRIRDFFHFHDTLNVGKITCNKFMNVLTLFGFQFSPEELESLANRYKIVEGYTSYTKYRDFCGEVEAASKSNVQPDVARDTAIVNPRARTAIERVRGYVERNRINVLPPFQDFDRTKRGYVTELQFGRVLSMLKAPLKADEVPLLIDLYGQQTGVDYFKFVEDVDPGHGENRRSFQPLGKTKDSIQTIYGRTPAGDNFVTGDEADALIYESKRGLLPKMNERSSISELLGEMQRWAYVRSVMFHDFLKDFDQLNLGEVTNSQFRSALLMSGYRLTDNEYDLLIDAYKSSRKPGFVMWRKFADDVMTFVAPKTLEVEPLTEPLRPHELMAKTVKDQSGRIAPTPAIVRILDIVRRFVIARRISLKEQFVDKDRHGHRLVSPTGFAQVIQLLGVHMSKGEIDQLCTFYIDPATKFVRYPDFIADVREGGGVDFGENAATKEVVNQRPDYAIDIQHFVATRPKLTADQIQWNTVLPKLQSWILKRRIRIYDFFENFDRLRHGTVTMQKFRSVIGQIDMPLSEDEIQFIGKLFALEDKPDLVNYRLLCEQIEQVFGVKDLHLTPGKDATCRAAYLPDPSLSVTAVSGRDAQAVAQVIERMQQFVATRRTEVRSEFQDYDKTPHRNYVTKTQFKRCIGRLGLSGDETELELLARRYKCTDLDECNYHAFCNDIEATSTSTLLSPL